MRKLIFAFWVNLRCLIGSPAFLFSQFTICFQRTYSYASKNNDNYSIPHYVIFPNLTKFVLELRHPGPRHEWSGVGSCLPCATSAVYPGLGVPRDLAGKFREATFCAQALYLRAVCLELNVQFHQKSIISPWADQGDHHGNWRRPKVVQGLPEWSQNKPKVSPRKRQGSRRTLRDEQNRQLYTHKQNMRKLTPTAIQRPASITYFLLNIKLYIKV